MDRKKGGPKNEKPNANTLSYLCLYISCFRHSLNQSINQSINQSVSQSINICLSVCLSVCLSIYLSIYLSNVFWNNCLLQLRPCYFYRATVIAKNSEGMLKLAIAVHSIRFVCRRQGVVFEGLCVAGRRPQGWIWTRIFVHGGSWLIISRALRNCWQLLRARRCPLQKGSAAAAAAMGGTGWHAPAPNSDDLIVPEHAVALPSPAVRAAAVGNDRFSRCPSVRSSHSHHQSIVTLRPPAIVLN